MIVLPALMIVLPALMIVLPALMIVLPANKNLHMSKLIFTFVQQKKIQRICKTLML